MNRLFAAGAALVALALSGCATAIPQALDPAGQPQRFAGPGTPGAPAWPDAAWWDGFGDPQLSELIGQAQAGNRDVAAAAARVLQAKALTAVQGSALFPQVTGQGGHVDGGCAGQACQQYTAARAFNLSFGASYELDLWGVAHDNLRSAKEQQKAARFAQQATALAVTANTADQYFNVLAVRRRIAIAHENVEAIDSILDVIKLRVKAGSVSHLDLASEQAQLEAVEAQASSLETGEREALYALAVLLGRPPEGFDVQGQALDAVTPPVLSPDQPSSLLLRRPDVAQAEASLAAAHANLDAARAAFLPQVSLTGSGGFVSAAVGTLLQGSNAGYSYGGALLQTLFDGGRLKGLKDLAEGQQQALVAQYQGAVLGAYADVENALVEVADTGRAQDHLGREVTAAHEAFQISQLQYRQGATDLLTVLQAQQTLFSAEDQLAQAALANRVAAVHLYEALGGGWVEPAQDRTQLVENRPPR